MRQFSFLIMFALSVISTKAVGEFKLADAHWRARNILPPIALLRGIDPNTNEWKCLGAGVLVDFDTAYESVFLVTNRHIFLSRDSFQVEMRSYHSRDSLVVYQEISFRLVKASAFCPSTKDSDFVAIPISRSEAKERGMTSIQYSDMATYEDLNLGDDVEFYGYPSYDAFGLSSDEFNVPLVRRGTISFFAVRDFIQGQVNGILKGEILIDGISMGGNSGGPVFLRLQPMTIPQKGPYRRYMFGIIRGHFTANEPINDTSVVVGPVTRVTPVRPSGNSGLAIVVPMKMIEEFVRVRMTKVAEGRARK